jgi:hypothetical protein
VIRNKTVFVLGAGFSAEVGFPMGTELKRQIRELANTINSNGIAEASHQAIYEALAQDIGRLRETMQTLASALDLHPSIDALVHHFEGDPDIALVARMAIADSILRAEGSVDWGKTVRNGQRQLAPLHDVSDSALASLFNHMLYGVTRSNLHRALDYVSFVNFNYDRSLEHYFFNALKQRSRLDDDTAARFVREMRVWRPYGSLGRLSLRPEEARPHCIEFGARHAPLEHIAWGIRTYSEAAEADVLEEARAAIANAERVVFLGCAYHDQNLDLLRSEERKRGASYIFGTIYEPAPDDPRGKAAIDMRAFLAPRLPNLRNRIWGALGNKTFAQPNCTLEPLTCLQLVEMYRATWN